MPPVTDLQFLTSAAEQAASAGDFVSAEQQLRLAVEVQEENIGPMHPDLANTLNNLGVIYERLERPVDAERCYRRAFAIASAVLDPHHPFLTLSATNLRGFCLARGIPFEAASARADARRELTGSPDSLPEARIDAEPTIETGEGNGVVAPDLRPTTHAAEQVLTVGPSEKRRHLGLVAAAASVLLLLAIVFVATRPRSTVGAAATRSPVAESPPPPAAEAPLPKQPEAPSPQPSAEAPPQTVPDTAETAGPTRDAGATSVGTTNAPDTPVAPAPANGTGAPVRLVSADLCRSLETRGRWRCTPADAVQRPGQLFFYTRVASPVDATIEHRWYREDRLVRTVPLRVRANQRDGFRTYSRTTVTADRAGAWRVELRNPDGDILQEARVTVSP